jgi:hypothetical protein
MFFEEVEIAPGVFDQFLLVSVDRLPGVSQSINDGPLGCFDFLQQGYWVQLDYSIVVKRQPVAVLHFGPHFDDVPLRVAVSARQYNANGLT